MSLKFLSLASGSSGNCYFLGTEEYGILFDAGISIRTIKKVFKDHKIEPEQIMGVFVTHDHADHIKSVGALGEKYNILVYATKDVHEGIDRSRYVEEKLYGSKRIIEKEISIEIKDFRITAFEIPHDSSDNVGYLVEFGEHKIVLATDVGHISDTVAKYIRIANHLIIEANYDSEMLRTGRYPAFLKERIVNSTGHLSNKETAEFLAANFDLHLKNIWLCHLSKENNHPELACKTVEMAFGQYGIRIGKDVNLSALKRSNPSDIFYF
ncbi:MAG: MBL fold metallo-hydrolase [Dysgonamonadaceae bacterium]|jgi:phosphoribosyl 1,2-cyclic phosphodiesterase|nr:MBL fold metallo-hydrolase [Dysgonamonadaceae bacterium]